MNKDVKLFYQAGHVTFWEHLLFTKFITSKLSFMACVEVVNKYDVTHQKAFPGRVR